MGFGNPGQGETIVVSGAAGSVGSLVGQLVKAEGLNVTGVAAASEKCEWLANELCFEGVTNDKTDDLTAKLRHWRPRISTSILKTPAGRFNSRYSNA